MPNNQGHDPRVSLPANRLAQAITLQVDAVEESPPQGTAPTAPPIWTPSKTSSSVSAIITQANGATSYECTIDGGTTVVPGLTVSGLNPEQTYPLQVRGSNEFGGPTAWSAAQNITTNAAGSTGFTGANGETITLTGSGFGALANPKPAAMDDMSYSGTSNGVSPPATLWGNVGGDFGDGYVIDEAVALPGRSRSVKAAGKKSYLQDAQTLAGGRSRSVDSIYSTFWIRLNESTATPPQPGVSSNKIIRIWDNPSKNGVSTAWQATEHPFLYFDNQGGNATISTYPSRSPFENSPNTWHRVEQYQSVNGAGPIQLFLNGKRVSNLTGAFKSSVGGSDPFFTHLIGYDVSQRADVNDTLRHWLADFYEQPDLARVELSNSPTMDVTTEQERYYQETITRSDTEVTFKAFYGGLNTGQPIYAHIIKADGTVINWGQIN